MRLSAFETYSLFLALKNHFTQTSYDFFKYHGKTRANADTFAARKDRFHFQRLSRKYSSDQMMDFVVSNLVKGKSWVGEFLDDDAHDNYMEYLKRKQSLAYTFANDLDRAFNEAPITELFRAKNDAYPAILNLSMQGNLSLETFVLLDRFLGFSKTFDEKFGIDDVIWGKLRLLSRKYTPFLQYDHDKMKNILKEKINEYK